MPRRTVPEFASEAEEWAVRETHDTVGLVDWTRAERVRLPNLKPSTIAISLRLPAALLERIKLAANQCDVPYQSLIKPWLAEKVAASGADRSEAERGLTPFSLTPFSLTPFSRSA